MTSSPAAFQTIARSAAQTRAAGQGLAGRLRSGDVVLLSGDLVAGKTNFTQGLAAGLGITDHVQSPTFTVVAEYQAGSAGLELIHIDLYRLEGSGDLASLGLEDLLGRDGSISAVEWPERLQGDLDVPVWRVAIAIGPDEHRTVTVEPPP